MAGIITAWCSVMPVSLMNNSSMVTDRTRYQLESCCFSCSSFNPELILAFLARIPHQSR